MCVYKIISCCSSGIIRNSFTNYFGPVLQFNVQLLYILQIDIPPEITGSFYQGNVYVGFKDSILQPSSPLRHAAELVEILKLRGIRFFLVFKFHQTS